MLYVDTWPWDMITMGCDVLLWPSNDMSSGKFDYKSKIIVWANAFPMLFVSIFFLRPAAIGHGLIEFSK